MQIDEILKAKKTARRKKKTNEEVLDSFADHEVSRLREAMNSAAEEDINSNHEKVPAVAKLRLLPEAMETLRKSETRFIFLLYILNSTAQGIASTIYDRQQFIGCCKKMAGATSGSVIACTQHSKGTFWRHQENGIH